MLIRLSPLSSHVFLLIARCKGVVVTHVTCLYLVFPIEGETRGGFYICLYLAGFASVVFFYLSQGKGWVI